MHKKKLRTNKKNIYTKIRMTNYKKTRSVASHRNNGNYWICLIALMEMNVCTHVRTNGDSNHIDHHNSLGVFEATAVAIPPPLSLIDK